MTRTILRLQVKETQDASWVDVGYDPETVQDAADFITDAECFEEYKGAFRLVHLDLTDAMQPVATDITGDLIKALAKLSHDSRTGPGNFLEAAFIRAGLYYYSQDDANEDASENRAWERQLQSLRPSHSTHL